MDIEITIERKSAIVSDNEIGYDIFLGELPYIYYNSNRIYVPFIKDLTHDAILACHEEIKRRLLQLDNIIDNLPILELCRLPTLEDFNSNDEILLSNGDYIDREYCIRFYQMKEKCSISIYCISADVIVKNMFGDDSHYNIGNKITINNQPFNAELFAESIRTYSSNYLTILFSIFKPNNTKSAKLN